MTIVYDQYTDEHEFPDENKALIFAKKTTNQLGGLVSVYKSSTDGYPDWLVRDGIAHKREELCSQ